MEIDNKRKGQESIEKINLFVSRAELKKSSAHFKICKELYYIFLLTIADSLPRPTLSMFNLTQK